MLVFRRVLGSSAVTVCINAGRVSAKLPDIDGRLFWSDGLRGSCLSADGFAVFTNEA